MKFEAEVVKRYKIKYGEETLWFDDLDDIAENALESLLLNFGNRWLSVSLRNELTNKLVESPQAAQELRDILNLQMPADEEEPKENVERLISV